MRQEEFGLVAVESTNIVMKLEKELEDRNLEVKVIPVPKEITANCGLSIKFNLEELESVKLTLSERDIKGKLYKVNKVGFKREVFEL